MFVVCALDGNSYQGHHIYLPTNKIEKAIFFCIPIVSISNTCSNLVTHLSNVNVYYIYISQKKKIEAIEDIVSTLIVLDKKV